MRAVRAKGGAHAWPIADLWRKPSCVERSDPVDEMTWLIYALKEIRACLEAEILTDVQQRLTLLSRDMENHNGQRIPHQPAFSRS